MAEELSELAESKGLTLQEYVLFVLVDHLSRDAEEEEQETDESSDSDEDDEED